MSNMQRALMMTMICVLGLSFAVADVYACSCRFEKTLTKPYNQAVAVVYARAQNSTTRKTRKVRFKVKQSFKGTFKRGDVVRAETGNSTCGVTVKKGQLWMLFVREEGKRLVWLSSCSDSKPVEKHDRGVMLKRMTMLKRSPKKVVYKPGYTPSKVKIPTLKGPRIDLW